MSRQIAAFGVIVLHIAVTLLFGGVESGGRQGSGFTAALTHQHQHFYGTPFSYTGIDICSAVHPQVMVGLYGTSFLSSLKIATGNGLPYLRMWQTGVVAGVSTDESNVVQTGLLLRTGYLSIEARSRESPVVYGTRPDIRTHGVVFQPQLFGAVILAPWMKFRAGIGYDLYTLKEHSWVKRPDITDPSVNFAFICGCFKRR